MGGDSYSEGRWFESRHRILDGHIKNLVRQNNIELWKTQFKGYTVRERERERERERNRSYFIGRMSHLGPLCLFLVFSNNIANAILKIL